MFLAVKIFNKNMALNLKKTARFTLLGLTAAVAGFAAWLYWPTQSGYDELAVVKRAPDIAQSVLADTVKPSEAIAAPVGNSEKKAQSASGNDGEVPVSKIRSIVKMDFGEASIVENEKGELMLVSSNDRFAMMGVLVDTWKKEEISTAKQAAEASRHIPTAMLGLAPEGMNAFSIGSGKDRVSIFVDPQCHWCHKLIEEVSADDLLTERFTFDFYVVAALGNRSDAMARQFLCADVAPDKRADLFQGAPNSFAELKQIPKCSLEPYKRTLTAAQLIGVKGVPFVIAPDGSFTAGKPRNMRRFLMSDKK